MWLWQQQFSPEPLQIFQQHSWCTLQRAEPTSSKHTPRGYTLLLWSQPQPIFLCGALGITRQSHPPQRPESHQHYSCVFSVNLLLDITHHPHQGKALPKHSQTQGLLTMMPAHTDQQIQMQKCKLTQLFKRQLITYNQNLTFSKLLQLIINKLIFYLDTIKISECLEPTINIQLLIRWVPV